MVDTPDLWWIHHSENTLVLKLLAIDDDEMGCEIVTATFAPEGFDVIVAHDARRGLERAAADDPDVILLDLHLPDLSGLEVLERLRRSDATRLVVLLTGDGDLRTAVRAMQFGAFDYLTKPVDPAELLVVVRRALETRALRAEVAALRQQVGEGGLLAAQMGPSAAVQQVTSRVRTVAASNFSVLVLGETGAGKELVAQAIHRESARRGKPFIALDCGAIPEPLLESELFGHEKGAFTGADRGRAGQFRLAEGGTLFLDEVGNLPLGLQAKLLRVLESRQVQAVGGTRATELDVRFVAATNDDLQARVAAGRFRADLYFRLAQYTIVLPPLRDRPEDIPYLAQRFLEEARVELRRPVQQIAPDAIAQLQRQRWPGNVRELRNVVRQAVLESSGSVLSLNTVQPLVEKSSAADVHAASSVAGRTLREVAAHAAREAERQSICEALRATRGNKSQAARALVTDYKTLHLKMKDLGIRARDFNP
jgi:DNA-binding NtrC family response regulator